VAQSYSDFTSVDLDQESLKKNAVANNNIAKRQSIDQTSNISSVDFDIKT